jgi:hypothetical protein
MGEVVQRAGWFFSFRAQVSLVSEFTSNLSDIVFPSQHKFKPVKPANPTRFGAKVVQRSRGESMPELF